MSINPVDFLTHNMDLTEADRSASLVTLAVHSPPRNTLKR